MAPPICRGSTTNSTFFGWYFLRFSYFRYASRVALVLGRTVFTSTCGGSGRMGGENYGASNAMQRRCPAPGRRLCFDVARPLARLEGKAASVWQRANQTARTAAPATRCNDVTRIGQFRHFAGSMSFGTTPPGDHGQARTADRPQNG
jgi:hypothetical protein